MPEHLHTCAEHAEAAPAVVKGGPRAQHLTVDMHCHALTVAVEAMVADRPEKQAEGAASLRSQGPISARHSVEVHLPAVYPKLTSLALRLQEMDAMGVDVQVVSPAPTQYYYWADPELAQKIVAEQNHHIAEMCEKHPDRLVGLGNIALQHPELSVQQLTYAVKELGLRGVEISSAVNGLELADPKFESFWAKAEELGVVVFLHPLGSSLGPRLNQHYLSNIVGQPVENAIALSHLIFGGVLDRYPGLRICAAHGGGYLPTYAGRGDHAWRDRPDSHTTKRPPSSYLRQIWFDDLVYTPQAVRHLIEAVGLSQVVVGTDFPYDMGQYDVHGVVAAVEGLSDADHAAILGGNALRLLDLDAARFRKPG
jgi:aminocarboxymuconate-semialdehyde decarboxylase